jgi:anaerobic selenocysteine-containing dehydrogenase
VHLRAQPIEASLDSLAEQLGRARNQHEVLMIGRRELRSNNSWMHNVKSLVAGKERCVLYVNPVDAERAGLRDSEPAFLESRVYSGEVPVRVTDEIMPGVVSLPHGWGHAASARWQGVAGEHAGVSANDWSDDQVIEDIVGQSILNGVPVTLSRAKSGRAAA